MRDETIDRLLKQVADIGRQLKALQRLDVSPPPSSIVTYSGTPTTGQLAQWGGAGTLTHSGYAGSAVARYSGEPTAGAITYWTGAGTVAPAGYGTADVFLLSGNQTATGVKTFSGTVDATLMRARNSSGVQFQDDGGNLGVTVADGGNVGIRTSSPLHPLHLAGDIAGTAASGYPRVLFFNPTFTSNPTNNATAIEVKTRLDAAITAAFAQMHINDIDTASTGSSTYVIGLHIAEQTFGTNKTNLYIKSGNGFATAPSGNYSMYNASTRDNYFAGKVGFGVTSPQGPIAADGFLYVKKTGIVGTKVVIIPNTAGDVTQVLTGFFTLSDGTSGVANAISMIPTDTYNIAVGGSNWRLTVAANGEFSVQRTSGSGTATMTFLITWI